MNFETLKMAFEALLANKVRSGLSMLGIVIGVSTVIIVVGIGLGSQQKVADQYKNLNVTSVIVMGMRGRDSASSTKISEKDVDYVLANAAYVNVGTAVLQGNLDLSYGKTSSSFSVFGSSAKFFDISNLSLAAGRVFTEDESGNTALLTVIGNGVLEKFWDEGTDPETVLGEILTVGNKKLEIIGVLKEIGSSTGPMSYDDSLLVPYSTAAKYLLGSTTKPNLYFLATDADTVDLATAEIELLLRANHKLKAAKENDFRIFDAGSMVGAATDTATTLTILLTSVAAIVLIVSGIGIMNVMFVTVTERTREIGIIKAVGGEQKDILAQFLAESVILSMIGGIIGIGIGEIAIPFLNNLEDWYVLHSPISIFVGFTFSVLVGIFFGFYPALKASRLDPVDALRSE
ncbi:MAG: ABC transporter permease [Patescibacteria group bacterium]